MKLYKYKSLEGNGFMHCLDMIVNERIYFPNCDSMNDIDEGDCIIKELHPDEPIAWEDVPKLHLHEELLPPLRNLIDKVRFCSFSTEITNRLLWAHYSGGYSGVAFEYDVPEKSEHYDLRPIIYTNERRISADDAREVLQGKSKPYDKGILVRKNAVWSYEKEFRMYLTTSDPNCRYLEGMKPTSVILGIKTNQADKVLVSVARKYGIPIGFLMSAAMNSSEYVIIYPRKDDPDFPNS